MVSCKKCVYFRKKKRFSNPNECTHPKEKMILYFNVAPDCQYFKPKDKEDKNGNNTFTKMEKGNT